MTSAFVNGRAHDEVVTVDPAPRPKRRSFDAAFKARVLAECWRPDCLRMRGRGSAAVFAAGLCSWQGSVS